MYLPAVATALAISINLIYKAIIFGQSLSRKERKSIGLSDRDDFKFYHELECWQTSQHPEVHHLVDGVLDVDMDP